MWLQSIVAPIIYSLSFGSDAYSTQKCLKVPGCYEQAGPINTGNYPTAAIFAATFSYVDYEIYKRDKKAAWGMRVGVSVLFSIVFIYNTKVRKELENVGSASR
jgi:hypothetical protein